MANGATETIVINTTVVDISSPITNFAQVETTDQDDVDSTPGNDTDGTPDEDDEDDVTILPEGGDFADLELTKTVNVTEFNVFEHVLFTITVTNKGPADASNVTVKDGIPAGLAFSAATPSVGIYSNFLGQWTIGDLPAGATETLVLDLFTLDDSAPITNFAQVLTATPDDPRFHSRKRHRWNPR